MTTTQSVGRAERDTRLAAPPGAAVVLPPPDIFFLFLFQRPSAKLHTLEMEKELTTEIGDDADTDA